LFLDFSKVSDTVPHSHLLLKLESLGITGDLLTCRIKAFLTIPVINRLLSKDPTLVGCLLFQGCLKALF